MNCQYTDLHCHTTRSDGMYSPLEVVKQAKAGGVGVLALTDHNILAPDDLDDLSERAGGGIRLLRGCEMSCVFTFASGNKAEIHVVVLNYDTYAPALLAVSEHNRSFDREAYIGAILAKLRGCGIDLGNYHALREKYSQTRRIGRMTLAAEMVERGFVNSVGEAFDEYIGAHGKRRAFVKNPVCYVPMEDAIAAALHDHGIPILAHLYYYRLTRSEEEELVAGFRRLAGPVGAMEVEYARYSPQQRAALRAMAEKYDLGCSAGSDYHGQDDGEHLQHRFPAAMAQALLQRQREVYGR